MIGQPTADQPGDREASPTKPVAGKTTAPSPSLNPGRSSQPSERQPPPPKRPPPPPKSTPPNQRPNDRGWWIGGFIVGFLIGLTMSMTYGWALDPRPAPIDPASLTAEDQEIYIRLVAAAFFHNRDLDKANSRIAKLRDPQFEPRLVALAERYIDENRDIRDVRALVVLAEALGQATTRMVVFLPTPTPRPIPTDTPVPPTATPTSTPLVTDTPTPTPTLTPTPTEAVSPTPTQTPTTVPSPTRTPVPTRTPPPGPDAPFGILASNVVCDSANGGLLKIYIRDRLGSGISGVQIEVSWPGGRDTLFTGFKPEIDPGYADFQMNLDEAYRLELIDLELSGRAPEVEINSGNNLCPDLPDTVNPSWQVEFQQGIN